MSKINLLDHPICFSHPLWLGTGSSLIQVPFAMFLIDLLRPSLVAELGLGDGVAYSAYAQAIRQLRLNARAYAVAWSDAHNENNHEMLDSFSGYHNSNFKEFSDIIHTSPDDALSRFSNGTIDLLHVSSAPANASPESWFESWLPKMSEKGVLLVQNIDVHQNSSRAALSHKLRDRYLHFDSDLETGVCVFAVGKDSQGQLLFQMTDRERSLTRELFHRLGLRLLDHRANNDDYAHSEKLESLSALLSARNSELETKSNDLDRKANDLDRKVEELREKNELIHVLSNDLSTANEVLNEQRLTVMALSTEVVANAAQLNNILNSRAWRWVTRYGHFKNRFVTPLLNLVRSRRSDVKTRLTRPITYKQWVRNYDTLSNGDREAIKTKIETLAYQPLISVIMPVYNVDEKWLRRAIESVREQLYENWELCIADDHSSRPHVREILNEYAALDLRIKVVFRTENGHISAASNSALGVASGEFTALLDHDDELAPHALYMIVEELNSHPDADLIYSDEDKIDAAGERFDPHFKTDWNPDLLYSMNFVSHLGVYRTSVLTQIGGFRKGFEGSQDYDLVLRFIEQVPEDHIRHVPHVLYHWRAIPDSVAANVEGKDYAFDAARNAIRSHFDRQGKSVEVTAGFFNYHQVIYPIPDPAPLVSVIIATRDRSDLLKQVVDGLFQTDYGRLEIVIIDNQSSLPESVQYLEQISQDPRVRVVGYDANFNFSAINNFGVKEARGDVICLLNNDIKVISPGWLKEMVSHALRPEVGAVGAKLYYENDTIQHAGVIIGLGGVAGHSHKHFPRSHVGYAYRTKVIQGYSAVTAACLVMRRAVYLELGGLNEVNLPIAFNDVDLCMRLRARGYRIVWTPYAELYHLESASRGPEETLGRWPVFQRECAYFRAKWKGQLFTDPYYNPNLTLDAENFSFSTPPRVSKPWRPGGGAESS